MMERWANWVAKLKIASYLDVTKYGNRYAYYLLYLIVGLF